MKCCEKRGEGGGGAKKNCGVGQMFADVCTCVCVWSGEAVLRKKSEGMGVENINAQHKNTYHRAGFRMRWN